MKNLASELCKTTYISRIFRLLSMVLFFVLLSACTQNVSQMQEEVFALPTVDTSTGNDFKATEYPTHTVPVGTQEIEITPHSLLTSSTTIDMNETLSVTEISPAPTSSVIQQTSEKDGMEMVYIPAGDFIMGNNSSDVDKNEKPEHTVYLDAYWIDKYEVTNSQFLQFIDETGYITDAERAGCSYVWRSGNWPCINGASWRNPTGPGSDVKSIPDHPVLHISWNDADAYCSWVGRDLPTEAQWEKAVRGEKGYLYPWGNETPTAQLANFDGNVGASTAVGSYPSGASPYAAMDLAGNVWEWVKDYYGQSYYYSKSSWNNPQGPASGQYRILRGGSWLYNESYMRSTMRLSIFPDYAGNNNGFRCAMNEEN